MEKTLNIQIQPNLLSNVQGSVLINEIMVASNSALFNSVHVEAGDDYINVTYVSDNIDLLWSGLLSTFRRSSEIRACSIVVCEGEFGWNDYLLLHHFDPTVELDVIK